MKARFVYESVEENKYLYVVHNTFGVENAKSMKKHGYDPDISGTGHGMAEGLIFGSMVFPPPKAWYGYYGPVSVKFKVPINALKKGYLIWDPGVQKKVFGKTLTPEEMFDHVFSRKIWEDRIIDNVETMKSEIHKLGKIEKFPDAYLKWEEIKRWYYLDLAIPADKEQEMNDLVNKNFFDRFKGWFDENNSEYNSDWEDLQSKEEEFKMDAGYWIYYIRRQYIKKPDIIDTSNTGNTSMTSILAKIAKLGIYNGFCGEGRFEKGMIYFGTFEMDLPKAIEYTEDKGETWKKL